MFNLFKKTLTKNTVEYSEVIEQIHNEFNIAGEKAVAAAKNLLETLRMEDEKKANDLVAIGFTGTKEAKEFKALEMSRNLQREIAEALSHFSFLFPQYKFITHNEALSICKKYNLYLGDVSQYTGFVPKKNVDEISKFFEK